MPDKTFAQKLLRKAADRQSPQDDEKSFTSERQHTAQAFNLHVERRDGRRAEGFAWSHYAGYQWTDEGNHERLVVVFGMRAVEIEGQNLGVLVGEIREGQLNSIRELASGFCGRASCCARYESSLVVKWIFLPSSSPRAGVGARVIVRGGRWVAAVLRLGWVRE